MRTTARLIVLAGMALSGAMPAAVAGQQPKGYVVKGSDIAVPPGSMLGDIRRITHPFRNWTLICDQNLKARTKVCNVTQTIVDADGATVFSWTLAATGDRQAVLILRAPPSLGVGEPVTIAYAEGSRPLSAPTEACDERVCVATLRVGPVLRQQIAEGNVVTISFETAAGPMALRAPLSGLATAVAAID